MLRFERNLFRKWNRNMPAAVKSSTQVAIRIPGSNFAACIIEEHRGAPTGRGQLLSSMTFRVQRIPPAHAKTSLRGFVSMPLPV